MSESATGGKPRGTAASPLIQQMTEDSKYKRKAFPRINRRFMIPTTEGKCWDNKENRILNIKKENENKKEILLTTR